MFQENEPLNINLFPFTAKEGKKIDPIAALKKFMNSEGAVTFWKLILKIKPRADLK